MFKLTRLLSVIALCFSLELFAAEKPALPTLAPVLKDVMPAIVNIAVQGYITNDMQMDAEDQEEAPPQGSGSGQRRKFKSIGSGVIVDPKNGIIITNAHVIRHATLITVTTHDGRGLKATLIGSDNETDVAVLKVQAKNLHTLPIANSDNVEVGDFVVAIGNPFGLNSFGNSQSATFGIVSAMKRGDLNIEGIENFIQTDAAINPGNSGGALINTKGELIGINTAIISPYGGNVGIGFAIPINMAKDVAQQIIRFGSVNRGMMGIYVQHLTPEIAQAMGYKETLQGALVAQVNEDSPAEAAGIKSGDIIIQINDTKITQATQVKATISLLRVGSAVNITVVRNNKTLTLKGAVTDIKKQEQKLQSANPYLYGLSLRNFEQDSPMIGYIKGVQIVNASENSAGWRAGIRPGDVIIKANGRPTENVNTLQSIAKSTKDQLLVQVLRGSGALFILIV